MLFRKSLISFIATIALVGGVTASTTPVRRNDEPGCNPSTGSQACCTSTTNFNSLTYLEQVALELLDINLDEDLPVGVGCVLAGTLGCNNPSYCCSAVQQQVGLINLGTNCANL